MQVIGFAIAVQKSVIAKGLTVLREPPPPAPLPRSVANNKARFFARALVVNGRVEVRTERASRVEVRTERASHVEVRTERASRVEVRTERASRVEVRTERASRVEVRTERASRVGVRTERASRVKVRTERASRVGVRTERASRVGVRTERASSGTRSWTPIERDVNSNAVGQRGGNKTRIRQS